MCPLFYSAFLLTEQRAVTEMPLVSRAVIKWPGPSDTSHRRMDYLVGAGSTKAGPLADEELDPGAKL